MTRMNPEGRTRPAAISAAIGSPVVGRYMREYLSFKDGDRVAQLAEQRTFNPSRPLYRSVHLRTTQGEPAHRSRPEIPAPYGSVAAISAAMDLVPPCVSPEGTDTR